jgi:TolB-like protein
MRYVTLLLVGVMASGCAATIKPYAHRSEPLNLQAKTGLRLGVLPPVDERGSGGFLMLNMPAAAATLWLPLYPIGWNNYDRPERQASGIPNNSIGNYLASAAQTELGRSGMFESVTVTDTPNPTAFDAVLRLNVYNTTHKQTYTAWGLSVAGMLFWLLGAPEGVTTVEVDLGLTLMRASDGEILATDRKKVEASHWFGLWWGPAPSETQDEAVEQAFAGFLRGLSTRAAQLADKGKRGPQVVARVPPNLKGKAIAVMPLRAGTGLPTATVQSIGDLLLGEVSKRLPGERVIGMVDIENMLGLERLKDVAGCEDTACAAEIGGALGVDFLLTGSVGQVGSYTIVSFTLIDVHASRPVGRVTRKLGTGDLGSVIDAMPGAVDELL